MINSKTRQVLYALAAIVGTFSTWFYNISFMVHYEGFSISQFIADNYVNAASASSQ